MIDISAITNLISAFKTETAKDSISPERLGGLLQQLTDLLGGAVSSGELDPLETASLSNAFSGTINITKAAAASTLKTAYNNLPVNRMQFYIITDSNGLFLGDKVTAHADVAALFNKDSLGASVGDLLVLGKYKMVVNVAVYRIIPLNDAKPASGSFPGADGLETVWDKTQVNKVPAMETNQGLLNRGNSFRYFTTDNYNIDQCLDCGIYLYGRTGRSMPGNHSDEYYIVDVATRYNISDAKFYITQKVYSVNYPNRTFVRIIVTDSVTNYNGTYGDWILLSDEADKFYLADLGDFSSVKCSSFISEIRNRISAKLGSVLHGNYKFSVKGSSFQSLKVENCGTKAVYTIEGSMLAENLNNSANTIATKTSTSRTVVTYNGTKWGHCYLTPLEYSWSDMEGWILDETMTEEDLPNYPLNSVNASDIYAMAHSLHMKMLEKVGKQSPIDVSALFNVGGKMEISGADLLHNHLWMASANYNSTVSVVVGNQEFILVAHRRTSTTSYEVAAVRAVIAFENGKAVCKAVYND